MQAALKPLRLVKTEPGGELETLFQTHHARVFRTAQRITAIQSRSKKILGKHKSRIWISWTFPTAAGLRDSYEEKS